jgi:hypothetical protein
MESEGIMEIQGSNESEDFNVRPSSQTKVKGTRANCRGFWNHQLYCHQTDA